MVTLTYEQMQAVAESAETPPTLLDPLTQTTYVLLRKDVYDLLADPDYDDSPWTPEERAALACEAGKHAGWEEMN